MRLVPSLDAPSEMNFSASSMDEMPPAALIFTPFVTCCANSSTSWNVAPAVEKPVEVLIYSAPEAETIWHILIFSSSVSRHVSMMTFRSLPRHAALTALISSSRSSQR